MQMFGYPIRQLSHNGPQNASKLTYCAYLLLLQMELRLGLYFYVRQENVETYLMDLWQIEFNSWARLTQVAGKREKNDLLK